MRTNKIVEALRERERESSNLKNINGITLIALVITIIVLLILAGVTIQTLTGDNGLLQKAANAKQENEEARELELIKLAVSAAQVAGEGTITTENLNSELQANFNDENTVTEISDFYIYKTYKNYIIYKDGKVEEGRLLPDEYQQVEYIESTGVQWINTNVAPSNVNIGVELKGQFVKYLGNEYDTIIGCRDEDLNSRYYPVTFEYSTTLRHRFGDTIYTMSVDYEPHIVNFNVQNHKVIRDNKELGTVNVSSFIPHANNMHIFATNFRNREWWYGAAKLYYLKIFDNSVLIRDFIPCYSTTVVTDVNNKECPAETIGLYDTVEGKFYTNQGEGEFLKGEDI